MGTGGSANRPRSSGGLPPDNPVQQLSYPHQANVVHTQAPRNVSPRPAQQLYPSLHNMAMPEPHQGGATTAGYGEVMTQDEMLGLDQGQDTTHDQTLSRILTADEFMDRMDETEQRIGTLSQVEDPQFTFIPMKECLGLRGHMQDELLRIEAMLAEDDPELLNLRFFVQSHPRVVQKMRELRAKEKVIQTVTVNPSVTRNAEQDTEAVSSAGRDLGVQLDPTIVRTIRRQVSMGHSAGQPQPASDASDVTEIDLKLKHNEEEDEVAEDYAKKLVSNGSQPLSRAEIDRLLNDHAVSMQALRKKQEIEKKRQDELLEQKKRERLNSRNQGVSGIRVKEGDKMTAPSSGNIPKNSGKMQQIQLGVSTAAIVPQSQRAPPLQEEPEESESDEELREFVARSSLQKDNNYSDEFETDESEDSEDDVLAATLHDSLWQQHKKMTSEDFMAVMAEFREQQNERNRQKIAESAKHGNDLEMRLAEKNRLRLHNGTKDEGGDSDSMISVQEGGATSNQELQEAKKQDNVFVQNLIRQRVRNNMSEEEFAKLMRKQLEDAEFIRKWRQEEKKRMEEKLKERLARGEKTTQADEEDKETEEGLRKLAEKFRQEVELRRRMMTESQLQDLVAQYRAQQQAFLQSRRANQSRIDALLAQKLANNNRKNNQQDIENCEEGEKTDATFIDDVMKKKDTMSSEEFAALMAQQLANTEAIRKYRKGEKDKMDDKLQQRLQQRGQHQESDDEEETERSEEVKNLEKKFQEELAKRKKDITASELEAMMALYRKQQNDLLNKRRTDASRTDDLLQKKLEERKRQRKAEVAHTPFAGFDVRNASSLDEQFFQQLQQMQQSQEMTEDKFGELLKNYINQVDNTKTKPRKKQDKTRDSQEVQEMASSLVQEHQEQTKQIHNIRQRERQGLDEQLQKRLAMKGSRPGLERKLSEL